MMKIVYALVVAYLLVGHDGRAQNPVARRISYFNLFQRFITERNIDSAFYSAQMLANSNAAMANTLLHDSFAQEFRKTPDTTQSNVFAYQLLQQMSTGNESLQRVVYPLQQWVDVRQHLMDTARINQEVRGIMNAQERAEEPSITALIGTLYSFTSC